jgi:hypothetical protein
MIFTSYKKDTGLVVGVINAPTIEIARATATEDCDLLPGVSGEPNVDKVVDGKLVKQAQPEWMAEELAKAKRNRLLMNSDWTQLPDVPIDTKEVWAAYRQALRDVTDQPGFPFNIVWPVAPG